jgi:hypothetical protein
MRQDALARRNESDTPSASDSSSEARSAKEDYDALCAALGASARGRAFLDEHARRARQADTALALETLSRLEALLRQRNDEAEARALLRTELRALLAAVASARTNFNRFEGTLAKRETVMALFDMLEQRITEMLADAPAEIEPPANENGMVETEAVGWAERPVRRGAEPVGWAERSEAHRTTAAKPAPGKVEQSLSARPRESGDPEPQTPVPVALDPRLRGDERQMEALPTTAKVARQLETATPLRAAPAQQSDIVARINALTPAERIALFS